eukprot:Blabericola_migrator_1__1309@NODE_133_length_13242_cov_100_720987_g17_i1_p8_GENE_NODE_133_length_13242_cov_100_720987_g17_i1NODE_133_length_13242_cov_100_720987_g17_i1_p8_ORF_typecomplete_len204_score32_89EFhand_like/PF09279_11/1_4e03EFhand_like/PF09279_11/3_5e03EFhand_like/PF09279_11/1e08EFhand_10/PF14788_6/0_039EFhand_10/PF14788_6/7_1e03DUF3512/PF12024_8/0_076Acyl_transf_2/PF02273_15/0_087_NODE_133_length_13242_cov_100_720987_g17_i11018210793
MMTTFNTYTHVCATLIPSTSRLWLKAGLNEETSMFFDAFLNLLCAIGVVADGRYVWELFDTFNVDGSNNLEFDELMPMLERLFVHHDILALYHTYADETKLMSEEILTEFLQDVQQASAAEIQSTLEYMKDLKEPFVKTQEKPDSSKKGQCLTHIGFCHLLTSPKVNSILSPGRTQQYQDMSKPFTDYWISTCTFNEIEHMEQ